MDYSRRRLWQYAIGPALYVAGVGVRPTVAQEPARSGMNTPGRAELADMISGLRWSQMLSVVARLGIADHLRDGLLAVGRLAEVTRSHEDSLYRVLRTLASRGVFAEDEGRRFRLTPAADFLRRDVPGSLRLTAQVMGEEWYWNAWGALPHTVATGETGFDHVYGQNTWDWFAGQPEAAALFNAFQSEGTRASTSALMATYDFRPFRVVADVGGGEGLLLSAILEADPKARGILFELPHVIADAQKRVSPDLAARVRFVPGDFFRSVPEGADLYVLKFIIRDWNDEQARNILLSCRRAMARGATLLVIDQVICEPNQPCDSKPSDVAMMVRTGGRNRTAEEYGALLAAAGFDLTRLELTGQALGLLTAAPK